VAGLRVICQSIFRSSATISGRFSTPRWPASALDLPFKWVSDLKELHGPACGVDAHPAEDPTRLLVACLGKAVPFITAEGAKEGLHVDLSSHPVGR
jgi:hypothetical protein